MNSRRAILLSIGLIAFAIIFVLIWGFGVSSASRGSATPDRKFDFVYAVGMPKLPADAKTLRLWIPLPQSDHYQTISNLKIDSSLHYSRQREPEYGNEYVFVEAPAARIQQPVEVQVRFNVVRREHVVALTPGSVPDGGTKVSQAALARFLEPDRLVPLNGVIGDLARQETQGVTEPLAKAHKIYDYVVSTMRYDKSGIGWGRGDAMWACDAKRGNCTDFHSLFIGMARASGIPARFEIGFPLPADKQGGAIPGYHCWAEFYVQGYGWIPVDASEAWEHPEQREYFFGAHDVNRVQFTLGRDIRLKPPQQGEPLNYFIFPYAELDGKPFSGLENKFSFKDNGDSASRSPSN